MGKKVALPPYPNGWYCVGLSSQLKPGEVRTVQFMGEEAVMFRTRSGKVNVMDAYCPHLGGHFGHGGTVVGEVIRCPFHGFCFDGNGECVSTPYGTKPPPTAVVPTKPVRDINGFILVYHDASGRQPGWEIPEIDFAGWNPVLTTVLDLKSHPQETSENSVDLGHFTIVHGYSGIEVLKPLVTEGPYLNTKYAMHRSAGFLGRAEKLRAEFEVHVHGLGYSVVEVEVPKYGLQFINFVLSTPVENGRVHLWLGMSMKKVTNAWKVNPVLSVLPKALVNFILSKASFKGYVHDVKQDFHIWENKSYIAPPALAKGDGPVGRYRMWAKQFYPEYEREKVMSLAG